MPSNERKAYACQSHRREFVHQTLIRPLTGIVIEDLPLTPPIVAECRTLRPQLRCNCGMVDLYWEPTAEEADALKGWNA